MSVYPQKYFKVSFVSEGVLHICFNRPEVLNAVHRAAYQEFGQIFQTAGDDHDVRAIVISGEGPALTAGLDVSSFIKEIDPQDQERSRFALSLSKSIRETQRACALPFYVNKPVICVAHGPCIGLAVDIMTSCDLRIASKDAIFSVREIQIGMAADIGSLQRLPRIVNNLGWVKDICFTRRDFDAEEAREYGLVQRVYPSKEEAVQGAFKYAAILAAKSPVAMLGTKKAINYSLDHTQADSLDQIAEFNAYALGDDFVQGCTAMLTRKKQQDTAPVVYARL